jgi:hypothetical protein
VILAEITRGLNGIGILIYQCANNEESQSALWLPVIDFAASGQSRPAVRERARHFKLMTRSAPQTR